MRMFAFMLFVLSFPLLADNPLPVERLDTDEGYPYKNLIMRAQRVELIYSELGNRVECRVTVMMPDGSFEGEKREVSAKSFHRKPMQSCMDRDKAKQLLTRL
ncbi:hypothetical protein L2725_12145 [Shewanella corallii]|uniref:TonB C-terminal domain-containing protein n=1 Tax=Shewanella corallii TaxID=560080 RepID=A0ABT0N7T4_9GAMM|nr:hypothetical protein [Shewanella corallii]MCL2914517.1 hypothetical protein [Shewanella corallii]